MLPSLSPIHNSFLSLLIRYPVPTILVHVPPYSPSSPHSLLSIPPAIHSSPSLPFPRHPGSILPLYHLDILTSSLPSYPSHSTLSSSHIAAMHFHPLLPVGHYIDSSYRPRPSSKLPIPSYLPFCVFPLPSDKISSITDPPIGENRHIDSSVDLTSLQERTTQFPYVKQPRTIIQRNRKENYAKPRAAQTNILS